MDKPVKLTTLINQIENNFINFDKDTELYQNDVVAIYIYKIAEATAYDTRYTRDLFRYALEKGGYSKLSARLYIDPYEHWKTLQKRMTKGDTISLQKSNGKYQLVIDSEAFDMLNTDPNMPSTKHPRGYDSKLQPFIVEYVTDLFETSSDGEIEDVIEVLEEKLVVLTEGRKKKVKRSKVVV